MPKLDRKRPYGEIWGGNVPARFHQDGRYFDHAGDEVDLQPHHYDAVDTGARPQAPKLVDGNEARTAVAVEDNGKASAEAAIAAQRSILLLQAIPLLEKAQGEVIAELPDHGAELLAVMAEVEGVAKKRKAVLEALAAELQAKAAQASQDAAANGLTADQLGAQLGG